MSDDHRHVVEITAVFFHTKSSSYIQYSAAKEGGGICNQYSPEPIILKFKKEETIETTTETTYIRFQCGQSVKVSEKITSEREIK